MATIKALEGRTVHQIQSGQVIVDLCSVVKELLENSLDAGATSIEVRFKNNGLDSIEVQDNGLGIARDNYETIALKHYTSKLSSYDDLSSLRTYGFRGEALSSLCALASFHVTTARADEAPKGTRLDFEVSGKLSSIQVVASQKGTTVAVEDLFRNLPVRRRELEKNVKREYGKALGVLQAYACISTQARVSVSNVMAKGKKVVVFATRSCPTTKDNIANVFGAKVLPGLVTMDLELEMQPTKTFGQSPNTQNKQVKVVGYVSKPTSGDGRQTPDRQMFFVNARPCVLPQIAKVFNEVYKVYNVSHSPFVFSNMILDTNAYDVNVSPDKRTILLHEQAPLLDSLRVSLIDLFEHQDQSVPISQKTTGRLPLFKQLTVHREDSGNHKAASRSRHDGAPLSIDRSVINRKRDDQSTKEEAADNEDVSDTNTSGLIEHFAGRDSKTRNNKRHSSADSDSNTKILSRDKQRLIRNLSNTERQDGMRTISQLATSDGTMGNFPMAVADFNDRIAEQQSERAVAKSCPDVVREPDECPTDDEEVGRVPPRNTIHTALDRMLSKRDSPDVAAVIAGSKPTTPLPYSSAYQPAKSGTIPSTPGSPTNAADDVSGDNFSRSMRSFAAPESELLMTVGGPQTKSCVSTEYPAHKREDEVSSEALSLQSAVSSDESSRDLADEGELDVHSSEEDNDVYAEDSEYDGDYLEDDEKKAKEDAKVAELIRQAEERTTIPSQDSKKRACQLLKGDGPRETTTEIIQLIDTSIERIGTQLCTLSNAICQAEDARDPAISQSAAVSAGTSVEERLSLTFSKTDFANMHISGQFNLGFILATRYNTELFIIDQHASDEKYNFERLQENTVVQNQRLVQPRTLQLTAIEEEIISECNEALLKNGFFVDMDTNGDSPVGQRCKLISLPMSREVVFDITDLEELIALLAESPPSTVTDSVPRPTKVRRMFAMRACRSSVMIGKTLTLKQMRSLVRRMGEIDKPWNCPHGRPTMRHVCRLDTFCGWQEGDNLVGLEEDGEDVNWHNWYTHVAARGDESEGDKADHAEPLEVSHEV